MPELDIQRRQSAGGSWWAWLIGAIILALVIWWIVAAATGGSQHTAQAPAANPAAVGASQPPQEQVAGSRQTEGLTSAEWLPLAAMRANPDNYFGKSVSGVGRVAEVLPQNAFWIEQRGSRVLVVEAARLAGQVTPKVGQEVSLQGTVHNPDKMQQVPEAMKLSTATQKQLQGEPAFIVGTALQVQQQNVLPNPAPDQNGGQSSGQSTGGSSG
jgi:hypothetical protein